MRVLAPIKVSIFAFLLCFCLNIYTILSGRGLVRSGPDCLGFHGHSLRLPYEGLPKSVPGILVFAAVNLDADARRLESLRHLYDLVIVLKVTKGVCQAVAPARGYLLKAQAGGFALQQTIDGE